MIEAIIDGIINGILLAWTGKSAEERAVRRAAQMRDWK